MFNEIAAAIRRKNAALDKHRKVTDSAVQKIVRPDNNEKGSEEDRAKRLRNRNGDARER